VNGGRELAHEIIKKSEKDTHDARAEAKQAEEAAKRERRISITIFCVFSFGTCFVASN
jgi:Spy/CpxP family protein refolding chaperone